MLPPTRRPSPTAEKRVRSWSWQGTPQERGRVRRWKRTARRRHPGPEDRPEAPETDCGPAHRLRATQSRPTNAEVRRRMSPLGAGFLRAMRDPASAVLRQNRPTSRAPQDARTPLPGTSRCAQSAGGVVSALHMAGYRTLTMSFRVGQQRPSGLAKPPVNHRGLYCSPAGVTARRRIPCLRAGQG